MECYVKVCWIITMINTIWIFQCIRLLALYFSQVYSEASGINVMSSLHISVLSWVYFSLIFQLRSMKRDDSEPVLRTDLESEESSLQSKRLKISELNRDNCSDSTTPLIRRGRKDFVPRRSPDSWEISTVDSTKAQNIGLYLCWLLWCTKTNKAENNLSE